MRIIVDFVGGALDGHVEFDGMPSKLPRGKIESAACMAMIAGGTNGVGARFWSVSPKYVDAVRKCGPAEANAKGLAGRHLYEVTEYDHTPDVARAVCRFVNVARDE